MSFQSSPVPEDGCNFAPSPWLTHASRFQSSPVPEDGCNPQLNITFLREPEVSILTRPGGRVQPEQVEEEFEYEGVSILTRPGGRVQHRSGQFKPTT